ncbi:DUF1381 domain-containing protein [Staphylococcus haemolyticus]|uniref:DUF1381 domain-containing protein n=1 Tax=Staphylococcus haemolyticus TaxID=1283 RepID=UPI0021751020|nr:DUF1381 domain-containing protein [Staphylococcus haemolyticus]
MLLKLIIYGIRSETVPQYLIRQFKDSTGHIHTDIEKARTNETLSIVEAESKGEVMKKVKGENENV